MDNTDQFPVWVQLGNQYVMVAYHSGINLILAHPFKTRADKHCIAAYDSIVEHLKTKGLTVDLQVTDNEPSAEFNADNANKWKATFQLVPLTCIVVKKLKG